MNVCHSCGVPWDAGFFDDAGIQEAPQPGEELELARYELHRNYCGVLMSFAQFTDKYAQDNAKVQTPGYQWQIRCNGRPLAPYLSFDYILNPWGYGGFPLQLRLEEGCVVTMVIRNVDVAAGDKRELKDVGGRITGRYWYNADYGGTPNRL